MRTASGSPNTAVPGTTGYGTISQGFLELSNGTIRPGQIYLTRDARLKVFDEAQKKHREVPLRAIRRSEGRVLKEWVEEEWRFKENASDEKYFTENRSWQMYANSAAYAGQIPCSSLQQAVSRLGMQLITEIAMAVSVRSRMFGNAVCADLLAMLWKHSVLTGFYTKEIARALDIAEATTKIHMAALLRALGARNRTEAAFKAADLRLSDGTDVDQSTSPRNCSMIKAQWDAVR